MSLHTERGAMVLEDVARLPSSPPVMVEGTPLAAVSSSLPEERSIWLLPTEQFQQEAIAVAGIEEGPARLYAHMRSRLDAEVRRDNRQFLEVDGTASASDLVQVIEERLALMPEQVIESEARTDLIRQANLDIVHQVRAGHQRPWATGAADARERWFFCECRDRKCTATVKATVGDAARAPLIAAGCAR